MRASFRPRKGVVRSDVWKRGCLRQEELGNKLLVEQSEALVSRIGQVTVSEIEDAPLGETATHCRLPWLPPKLLPIVHLAYRPLNFNSTTLSTHPHNGTSLIVIMAMLQTPD